MDYLKAFVIPFSGLAVGHHHYDFAIGEKFFENFGYSEIIPKDLHVQVDMEKTVRMLIFDMDIRGEVITACDRCLGDLQMTLEDKERLIVKLGPEYKEESEDVIVIPQGQHSFDLSRHLYEYIVLLVPYQHVHPDDEKGNSLCDPEYLSKLEALKPEHHEDPRWDKLKGLKFDEN